MPAVPARMRSSPLRTSRVPSHCWFRRAWTHEPAVQASVHAVTTAPAMTMLWWRTVVIVNVTYASAPKNAKVRSPRLRMVAGSPRAARSVPDGQQAAQRRETDEHPHGGKADPGDHVARAERPQDEGGAGRRAHRVGDLVLVERRGGGPAEAGQRGHGDGPRHGHERDQAEEHPAPPEEVGDHGGDAGADNAGHDPGGREHRHHAGPLHPRAGCGRWRRRRRPAPLRHRAPAGPARRRAPTSPAPGRPPAGPPRTARAPPRRAGPGRAGRRRARPRRCRRGWPARSSRRPIRRAPGRAGRGPRPA